MTAVFDDEYQPTTLLDSRVGLIVDLSTDQVLSLIRSLSTYATGGAPVTLAIRTTDEWMGKYTEVSLEVGQGVSGVTAALRDGGIVNITRP